MDIRFWYELVRIQLKREEGQTMAEYGLLIAVIAIFVIAAMTVFRGALASTFDTVSSSL
jgi:pilus assembly protein Flp/PilA